MVKGASIEIQTASFFLDRREPNGWNAAAMEGVIGCRLGSRLDARLSLHWMQWLASLFLFRTALDQGASLRWSRFKGSSRRRRTGAVARWPMDQSAAQVSRPECDPPRRLRH